MRRRIINCLVVLSLLVCATTLAAWTWSYWRADYLGWKWTEYTPRTRAEWGDASVGSSAGGLSMSVRKNVTVGISISSARPGEPNSFAWRTYAPPSYPRRIDGPPLDLEKWGFAWDRYVTQSTVDDEHKSESYYSYNTVIPYWTIALLTAALPTWRGVSIVLERKRARRRSGFEPRLVGERADSV